jgi:fructosamine-3-kinase
MARGAGLGGLAAAIEAALGSPITEARPLSGGDINEAHALTLADGRCVFAKTNQASPAGMFSAEARGLAWLSEARAVRVPAVVAVGGESEAGEVDADDAPGFLLLELIRPAPARRDFDEQLGRGLAALHRAQPPGFGLDHDNFIGRLPQENGPVGDGSSWATFYRERRLAPLLQRAAARGLASPRMRRGFDSLFEQLEDLVGPAEPPARLHGDLWGGNLLTDETGGPCLIDPAVYGGHREIDLAMMKLFGGFGARVFDAYQEAFPLAADHAARVPLYQLLPLLVHVNLFGGTYVPSVEAALARLV